MATQIDDLPTPPTPSDSSAVFDARMFAMLGALPNLQLQANALSAEIWALYGNVLANTAAAVAKGTSTTSVAIGTGAKSFVTQASKGFVAGQTVLVSSAANRANWMWGVVDAYVGTALDVTVSVVGGSGTYADWDIVIAGLPGRVTVTDFTSSGTWTPQGSTRMVLVQVLGAGGGGGGSPGTAARGGGGGGGGGAYSEAWIDAATLGPSVTVTVGAGGAGASASSTTGATGGTSSFGSFVTAYGGAGGGEMGSAATAGAGGGGGGGSGGAGTASATGAGTTYAAGGAGGIFVAGATAASTAASAGSRGTDSAGGGGGSGGNGTSTTGTLIAGDGGCARWGGGGGGGGTSTTASSFGGAGGSSVYGGHGGGGGGSASGGNGGGAAGVTRNPVLIGQTGGAAGFNANGSDGGIACGGGGAINMATTARSGGAGGRGHVRVIEIGI